MADGGKLKTLGHAPVPVVPWGTPRDASAFWAALVPPAARRGGASGPRAHVPLLPTALLAKGRVTRVLDTGPGGEAVERSAPDKEALHKEFRTAALANPANAAKLVAIVHRADGSRETLDASQAADFFAHLEGAAGHGAAAVQGYVHAKGGDRATFRNVFFLPPGSGAGAAPGGGAGGKPAAAPTALTLTSRQPEALSPEGGPRVEAPPVRSYQDALNNALDDLTRRVLAQLEGAWRCRVVYAALEYVIDERDAVYLLWPADVRTVDVRRDGSLALPPDAEPRAAPAPLRDEDRSAALPAWAADKARAFEAAAAREAALAADFAALVDRTTGDGRRGHVLLVDAEPAAVVLAARALAGDGFAVTVATDGPRALEATRRGGIDCVLLARDLPSMSGLEVARVLRQREAGVGGSGGHVPLVAFTGSTEPDDLRAYMEAGFDGCVSKPLDVAALLSTMAAAVPTPTHSRRAAAAGGGGGGGGGATMTMSLAATAPAAARSGAGAGTGTRAGAPGAGLPPAIDTTFGGGGALVRSGAHAHAHAHAHSPVSPAVGEGGGGVDFGATAEGGGAAGAAGATGGGGAGLRGLRSMAAARRGPKSPGGGGAPPAAAPAPAPAAAPSPAAEAFGRLPPGAAIPGILPPAGGGGGSAAALAATLPPGDDEDGSRLGIFQLDAETALPYCVMGKPRPGVPLFHFVVVGDIFDTYEQYQILFRKVVQRMPGLRVLLFNYPGQAYTEWRKDVVLNNEYAAGVLQALLTYLGPGGTGEFGLDGGAAPFHLLAVGNGGPIATYFAAAYHGSHPSMRSLVMVNAFAHVDAHTAGVLHDAMNVFACSPSSRPDLPVYFFARFLFSPAYLAKVGAPLALNLYTAVSNPITLQGRIALCQGALAHVDTRPALPNLNLPLIVVASSKDGFVKPSHVAVMVEARGGEVRSIKRALAERSRAAVVWLRAGHEVFQEARKPMVNLLEQLASGYHERNDVAFLPLVPEDTLAPGAPGARGGRAAAAADDARARAAGLAASATNVAALAAAARAGKAAADPRAAVPGGRPPAQVFEDRFLDNVVATLRGVNPPAGYRSNAADAPRGAVQTGDVPDALLGEVELPPEITGYTPAHAGAGAGAGGAGAHGAGAHGAGSTSTLGAGGGSARAGRPKTDLERKREAKRMNAALLLDPESAAFANRDKEARARAPGSLGGGGGGGGAPASNPELKEYMSWRVRRNKRRLQRIEACAVTVQRAWRAYLARTLVARMRQQRAALDMQRFWRGCLGRRRTAQLRREAWASSVLQRYWRGFKGRGATARLKAERKAATRIQRAWRGFRARKFVHLIQQLRRTAAVKIQAAWRQFTGQRQAWKRRDERNAVVNIQRVWRGYLGRARAAKERDRYLFSKSQAQGIEFGRQMLMEHKLHGTKLQSEVSLLTKEKLATEEKIEAVLAEIATFEQGVRALEKEMVELSRAEAEAAGTLDEEAKVELRENKIRLDREFAAMLVKIADRRETLASLEAKLQTLDRARGAKREELRDLERRLVVLLESQQTELHAIRARQERRSENVVEDAVAAVTAALQGKEGGGGAGSGGLIADGTLGTVNNTLNQTLGGGGTLVAGGGGGGTLAVAGGGAGAGAGTMGGGGGGGQGFGPTPQQRAEAAALMASTETMMKFGFMSMSLTYFSSLNMVRAMRQLGTANTVLASNPMLALIGQMGSAAASGGNPAAVALAAAGGGGFAALGGPGGGGGGGGSGAAPGALALTAGGGGGPGAMTAAGATRLASSLGSTAASFSPALRAGGLPGQEAPELALWTVGDVSHWLDSLALGHYKDAFADAAIDGAFLSELTDDDLRNTLGIEHALHRKKILSCVLKLLSAELEAKRARAAAAGAPAPGAPGGAAAPRGLGATAAGRGAGAGGGASSLQADAAEKAAAERAAARDAGVLRLDELQSWVRHNKGKLIGEALASLPDGRFDRSLLASAYTPGVGTLYVDVLNGPAFHINKADDRGNSILLTAAQNGRMKVTQLLLRKGANPNHQNAAGNTAMHYAMAYQFHELAAWLADPEKGGADDTLMNTAGLSCYDGLGES